MYCSHIFEQENYTFMDSKTVGEDIFLYVFSRRKRPLLGEVAVVIVHHNFLLLYFFH